MITRASYKLPINSIICEMTPVLSSIEIIFKIFFKYGAINPYRFYSKNIKDLNKIY